MTSFGQPCILNLLHGSFSQTRNTHVKSAKIPITLASAATKEKQRHSNSFSECKALKCQVPGAEPRENCLTQFDNWNGVQVLEKMPKSSIDDDHDGSRLVPLVTEMADSLGNATVLYPKSVIRAVHICSSLGKLYLAKSVHAFVVKAGFHHEMFVSTSIMDMYGKCGDMESAVMVFDKSRVLDIVFHNSLLMGYASNGLFHQALSFFFQFYSSGIIPNHYSFSIVLGVCGTLSAVNEGKQLHAYIIKVQLLHESAVGNTLLTMYSRCGMVNEAEALFEKLPNRNFISWTTIITGFYHSRLFEKALRQFNHMRESKVEPTEYTNAIALACCGQMNYHGVGKALHAQTLKGGLVSNVFISTSILDMYAKLGEMDDMKKHFTDIGELKSNVSWNAFLRGYVYQDRHLDAMKVFNMMAENGVTFDHFTYSIILKASFSLPSLTSGKQIHSCLIKREFELSKHVGSSLIEMYAKCGELKEAIQVFSSIPIHLHDQVVWNSIIKAHSLNGSADRTIALFEQMIKEGIQPTSATFLAVLTACSHSGSVQKGQKIFECMVRDYGILPDEKLYCCIVDLFGRSGQLEDALNFIMVLSEPFASTLRPLLAACNNHGNLLMAESVARTLLEKDPNDITAHLTLSNMYARAGRWGDVLKQRKLIDHKRLKKEPGCSWIEVNNKIHKFFSRDKTHNETCQIYEKLDELARRMKDMGYIPDTKFAPSNTEEESDEEHMMHSNEKLAVSFGITNLLDDVANYAR